jgi:regulator of replication initiation timing
MARTTKNKAYAKDGKECQLTVLKTKIEVLKAEKKRLQSEVKSLEKQLEISGKPPRPKKEKPVKLSDKEKLKKAKDEVLSKYRSEGNAVFDTLTPIDAT